MVPHSPMRLPYTGITQGAARGVSKDCIVAVRATIYEMPNWIVYIISTNLHKTKLQIPTTISLHEFLLWSCPFIRNVFIHWQNKFSVGFNICQIIYSSLLQQEQLILILRSDLAGHPHKLKSSTWPTSHLCRSISLLIDGCHRSSQSSGMSSFTDRTNCW